MKARRFSFLAALAASTWTLSAGAAPPGAREVYDAFTRIAAVPLWPGFEPGGTPVAIYDGKVTWLFGHPHAPAEFAEPGDGGAGAVCGGQHDAVRANTSSEIGGVAVATMLLAADEKRSADELASIAVHEAFHVYQNRDHPGWSADEGALMTYPMSDPQLLMMRRCEAEALRRALEAAGGAAAGGWIAEALAWRAQRFGRLGEAARRCERGLELREGLAQYVERKSLGRLGATALPQEEFPPEALRKRCYDIGQALAVLLDRLRPGWPVELNAAASPVLDQMLHEAASANAFAPQALPPEIVRQIGDRAQRDAAELVNSLTRKRDEFLAQPGWTIRVVAEPGAEPLWPQGFDPMNLTVVGGGGLLHTRWLRLGNQAGSLEVQGRSALTLPAGEHPMFNGVREVVVSGLAAEPKMSAGEEAIFEAEGLKLRFDRATIERNGQQVIVRLRPA